jgi:hypothetical protein
MRVRRLNMTVHRIGGATIDIDCGNDNGCRVNIPGDGNGGFDMAALAEGFEILAGELRSIAAAKKAA